MIKLKAVSKGFSEVKALQDVTLSINKGSIFGLVGSNGAGKTTLLKLLTGIYRQDAGEVLIEGQTVYENVALKGKIAFIADELFFFANFSVREMANFYQQAYPSWNEERFLQLQEVFGLDPKKSVNRLSKGMKRQVAFWLAFATMPDLIVLDEPLDGLDPVMRHKVKNLLVQEVAERDTTIVISSHNLRDLEDICDHVAILHKGTLVLEKGLHELITTIHKVQVAFKDGVPEALLAKLAVVYQEVRGSVSLLIVRGEQKAILKEFEQHQPVILDILPLTLEETFIYEMGDAGYEIRNIIF